MAKAATRLFLHRRFSPIRPVCQPCPHFFPSCVAQLTSAQRSPGVLEARSRYRGDGRRLLTYVLSVFFPFRLPSIFFSLSLSLSGIIRLTCTRCWLPSKFEPAWRACARSMVVWRFDILFCIYLNGFSLLHLQRDSKLLCLLQWLVVKAFHLNSHITIAFLQCSFRI